MITIDEPVNGATNVALDPQFTITTEGENLLAMRIGTTPGGNDVFDAYGTGGPV